MTSAGFVRFSGGSCSISESSQVRIECRSAAPGTRYPLKEVLLRIRPRHVLITVVLLVALAAFFMAFAAYTNSLDAVKQYTASAAPLADDTGEPTPVIPTPAVNVTELSDVFSGRIAEPTTPSISTPDTQASISPATTTAATTSAPHCGAAWKRFRDSYYKVTSSKSFAGVESECERHLEGALVSVHDEVENAFLAKYVRVEYGAEQEFYIGLTHNRTAHWTWLDGSSFNFTAWDSSEPTDTDDHCVQAHSAVGPMNGRWQAVDCSSQRPAVSSTRRSFITGCPKDYLCGSGNITSPNYPFHYGNNENKTYHLKASSPDGLIVLTFVPIELDYSGDHVKVYDGPSVSGSPMRTFEYRSGAHVVRSSGQELTVTFTSDSASTASGFSASFRTELKS